MKKQLIKKILETSIISRHFNNDAAFVLCASFYRVPAARKTGRSTLLKALATSLRGTCGFKVVTYIVSGHNTFVDTPLQVAYPVLIKSGPFFFKSLCVYKSVALMGAHIFSHLYLVFNSFTHIMACLLFLKSHIITVR